MSAQCRLNAGLSLILTTDKEQFDRRWPLADINYLESSQAELIKVKESMLQIERQLEVQENARDPKNVGYRIRNICMDDTLKACKIHRGSM